MERMHKPQINSGADPKENLGYVHFAVSLESTESIVHMTALFRSNELIIKGEPQPTGDGYYESIIADPEGNLIEHTV